MPKQGLRGVSAQARNPSRSGVLALDLKKVSSRFDEAFRFNQVITSTLQSTRSFEKKKNQILIAW